MNLGDGRRRERRTSRFGLTSSGLGGSQRSQLQRESRLDKPVAQQNKLSRMHAQALGDSWSRERLNRMLSLVRLMAGRDYTYRFESCASRSGIP